MPASIVKLPKSRTPKFPDPCISCGADSPGATYRASTNAVGWWTWLLWSFGPRHTVEIPACEPCRRQLARQRWLRFTVNLLVMAAGVVVAGWLFQGYQGPFKGWLMMGLVLVCLVPVIVWETYFPRPFDMTASSDTVDYEFRDPNYAKLFAALN